jgi:hypothetical protein
MIEQVDLRVHDRVALDEIELYTEVLSAVAASDRPLTAEELDRVLGVSQGAAGLAWRPAAGGAEARSIYPGGPPSGPPVTGGGT